MTLGDSPDEYLDKLLLPAPRAAEQRGGREETGTICRRRRGERIGAAETCPRARRVAGQGGGAGEYELAPWRLGAAAAPDFNALILRGGQTEFGKEIASGRGRVLSPTHCWDFNVP